jgi:hypothetical protein
MKDYSFYQWNGFEINKSEAWVMYQRLCDEVFGEDIVDIDSVDSNNAVLMHLIFANQFETFYENLKAMLSSLKEKMESQDAMDKLIETVEQVVDPSDGEQAYAQLVVWNVLWDLFEHGIANLDSFAVDVMYDTEENKRAYELAHEHKHMVMEKFGSGIINEDKHIVVLVKAPWNNQKCCGNDVTDYLYFRSVARRAFLEYLSDDETELYDITDDYYGDELVSDVVKQLNGIVVIDMTAGADKDKVVCHSFKNPNSEVMTTKDDTALLGTVLFGDAMGMYEDFESDNY